MCQKRAGHESAGYEHSGQVPAEVPAGSQNSITSKIVKRAVTCVCVYVTMNRQCKYPSSNFATC